MRTEVIEQEIHMNDQRLSLLEEDELSIVLDLVGKSISGKFNQNIYFGSGSYNLSLLKDSLQYEIDTQKISISLYIDTGNDHLNDVAYYFEYGTGLHNTKGAKDYIRPVSQQAMIFREKIGNVKSGISPKGAIVYTKAVKGVKPIFMFARTIKWAETNLKYLQEKALRKSGLI